MLGQERGHEQARARAAKTVVRHDDHVRLFVGARQQPPNDAVHLFVIRQQFLAIGRRLAVIVVGHARVVVIPQRVLHVVNHAEDEHEQVPVVALEQVRGHLLAVAQDLVPCLEEFRLDAWQFLEHGRLALPDRPAQFRAQPRRIGERAIFAQRHAVAGNQAAVHGLWRVREWDVQCDHTLAVL